MVSVGDPVLAQDFSSFASDSQDATGTTTSTTFTATLTGGTACAVSFTAPTSGTVLVINSGQVVNNTAGAEATLGARIGTGSTPGGGTTVLAASELRALKKRGTELMEASHVQPVTGLTPGSTYNAQQQFLVTSGTGTFSRKRLIIVPIP